jgi:hypothetical protein
MLPIKASYRQWRAALLSAIRAERRMGLTPRDTATRARMAWEYRQRRKHYDD